MSALSSNSTSEENLSLKSTKETSVRSTRVDSSESESIRGALGSVSSAASHDDPNMQASTESSQDKEEQLVYLITNILFTILWRGIENNGGDSWKVTIQIHAYSLAFVY